MSTLVLVRHGQATPFENDSDRLSPLGVAQARKLAEFWLRQGIRFDRIFVGALRRHQATAEIVSSIYARAGVPWPAASTLAEFNEFPTERILKELLPALAADSPELRALIAARDQATPGVQWVKAFQKLLERVMDRWLEGARVPGLETWEEFGNRVRGGIAEVTRDRAGGRRIAVFTSGGPVAIAVQTVVSAPEAAALEIAWRVQNCSLTGFVFSGDRISLDYFNATPHLDDPSLQSYR